jgi:hypothetical protein
LASRRAALLAFLAFSTAAPAAAQQWITFQPGGLTGFRVDFPGTPIVNGSNAAGTRYGMSATVTASSAGNDGVTFYATYTVYPTGTAAHEPQKVLDTVQLGRTALGRVRSLQKVDFEDHPAQRTIVDWHGPQRLVIVALDVTRGDWLYSIYCFAPPRAGEQSCHRPFHRVLQAVTAVSSPDC